MGYFRKAPARLTSWESQSGPEGAGESEDLKLRSSLSIFQVSHEALKVIASS